jgi:hypothetical protein
MRRCFWERRHDWRGRLRELSCLGLKGRLLKGAYSSKGAWHLTGTPSLQTALRNGSFCRYGFLLPSDLAATD